MGRRLCSLAILVNNRRSGYNGVKWPKRFNLGKVSLNAELSKKALEKVGHPNTLINLVSRRVRQLNAGGGSAGRPLVSDTVGLGAADIALREIIEDKINWREADEALNLEDIINRKRGKKG